MIYADMDFYQLEYFGQKIEQQNFDRLAMRASTYIDHMTMGRAERAADLAAVKMCCCALAEQFARIEACEAQSSGGKELKSQTVGAWSQTYKSGMELELEARKRLPGIVYEYLGHTGLLYRGVRNGVSACCDDL